MDISLFLPIRRGGERGESLPINKEIEKGGQKRGGAGKGVRKREEREKEGCLRERGRDL